MTKTRNRKSNEKLRLCADSMVGLLLESKMLNWANIFRKAGKSLVFGMMYSAYEDVAYLTDYDG